MRDQEMVSDNKMKRKKIFTTNNARGSKVTNGCLPVNPNQNVIKQTKFSSVW